MKQGYSHLQTQESLVWAQIGSKGKVCSDWKLPHRLGFTKSEADPNLYYIVVGSEFLILVLYVDNLILTGIGKLIQEYKRDIGSELR